MENELKLRRPKSTRLEIGFIAVILCFAGGCQSETAKWEFARGLVAEEAGDSATAIARMQAAVSNAPHDVAMKLELARVLADEGDRQALDICDEVLAEYPPLKSPYRFALKPKPYFGDLPVGRKSICLQQLGEFEEALANYKLVLADRVKRDSFELNNLAYFRALANQELSLAARDIDSAVEQEEENRFPSGLYLSLRVRTAIAIAVVSRHLDRQQQVLRMLNEQINRLEGDYANFQAIVSMTVFAQIQLEFPLDKSTEQETELIRINQDLIRANLVSLLAVRALIYQDLKHRESANADRLRVRELGYDADKLVNRLPDKFTCLDALYRSTMFLDTRGFVFGLLPWNNPPIGEDYVAESPTRKSSYRESLIDLNLAVTSATTMRLAMEGSLYNTPQISVADVRQMYHNIKHTEAVLLFHRAQVHERAGNSTRAKLDRQTIESLGFDPSEKLF